jgi:lipoprotein-anchoring transpeptidase ErfK/SrfK
MRWFKGKGLFFLLILALAFLAVSVVLGTAKKTVRVSMACTAGNFSGQFENDIKVAYFEGTEIGVPGFSKDKPYVLGVSADGERYIEVDLSEQKLKAWDGGNLFLETPISTGLPWWPTPQGEFRIWIKLRYTRMEGGEGRYYYNLPNVPYVMYFQNDQIPGWRGYGLHGAYWHNSFGTPRSHGCVNLPIPQAEKLYYWTTPTLPEGQSSTYASSENVGTRIIIHE